MGDHFWWTLWFYDYYYIYCMVLAPDVECLNVGYNVRTCFFGDSNCSPLVCVVVTGTTLKVFDPPQVNIVPCFTFDCCVCVVLINTAVIRCHKRPPSACKSDIPTRICSRWWNNVWLFVLSGDFSYRDRPHWNSVISWIFCGLRQSLRIYFSVRSVDFLGVYHFVRIVHNG